jgi:hypothetical protein
MTRETLKRVQEVLRDAGHYTGAIDGLWGKGSEAALFAARQEQDPAGLDRGAQAVARLNLTPKAKAVAEDFLRLHPSAVFTSGRRGVDDQARAMAGNVQKNARWIEQTYRATAESRALQAAVDADPRKMLSADIAARLVAVMRGWSDEQRARVSKHFSGDAFDVQPREDEEGRAQLATLRRLVAAAGGKFLDREGGLVRWHAQF